MKNLTDDSFSATKFVDNLLKDGANIPCDDTNDSFTKNTQPPPFYNAELYKKGQDFFKRNIFALLYSKLLGLLSVLAVPSILDILVHTNMSGSQLTAYRRYLATIFHMVFWYKTNFSSNSDIWSSINVVKSKHNSASLRGCKAGLHRISQKDMALTQFGFMGFAVAKPDRVGVHNVQEEELRAFIHIWRVVGAAMGIEERFNICRESTVETQEICSELIGRVFRPNIEQKEPKFIEMATYLVDGLWCMNPTLGVKTYLTLLYDMVQDDNVNNNIVKKGITEYEFVELGVGQKIHLVIHKFTTWSLKYAVPRWYHNSVQFLALWLMDVFPFLAYYSFGKENSHVRIF